MDFTAFDVIYPAVQTKSIISQSNRDTRMRFNVVELRDNVLFHHGVNFIDWLARVFLDHGFRGIGIVQPVSHSRHRIQRLAIGDGFHRAAVGVSGR